MVSDTIMEYLFEYEAKKYPYYDVIEIDIRSYTDDFIIYQSRICSRLDPKWSKWESRTEVKVSELISYVRDEKIKSILQD